MFSKTTEYALRATIFIAQKGSRDKMLSLEEIAEAIDSPQSFTAKVLQLLTRGNKIVNSMRGRGGGFYINETAKQLPLIEVINTMGEGDVLTRCVLGLKQCSEVHPCPLHETYRHLKEDLINIFQQHTIGQVANEMNSQDVYIRNRLGL